MADVAHSTLTGADLHEPKGVASAASGTVYISNGLGSGSWGTIATALNFTGMIADFAVPVAPTGWLECDGSTVSRLTYADLFAAVTVQQSGTRSSGSAVITGLSSTTNMKAGYHVSGSGIPSSTTVLSVDSSTQITLSANATSSGTSTVVVGPWSLGDGSTTFSIPDLKTAGRYRRSRTSSVDVGAVQADQNKSHSHTLASASAVSNGAHTHTTTEASHTHASSTGVGVINAGGSAQLQNTVSGGQTYTIGGVQNSSTGLSINSNGAHTHTLTGSTDLDGSSEVRPLSVVVMTCIKY